MIGVIIPATPKTRNDHSESMWPTSQPKFMPKNPVANVSGRKIVATIVSRPAIWLMSTFSDSASTSRL